MTVSDWLYSSLHSPRCASTRDATIWNVPPCCKTLLRDCRCVAGEFLLGRLLHPIPARAANESTLRTLDEQWSAMAAKNDLEGTLADG